jgi:hypothetical protein
MGIFHITGENRLWTVWTNNYQRCIWRGGGGEKGGRKTLWSQSASELYQPSNRHFSAKLLSTFLHRRYNVVSVMDPYGRILGFWDQSRYSFFQVAPQLYSRGWVDPIPDPLLLRISGSTSNRTWTSESVARNSEHQTTEAVKVYTGKLKNILDFAPCT